MENIQVPLYVNQPIISLHFFDFPVFEKTTCHIWRSTSVVISLSNLSPSEATFQLPYRTWTANIVREIRWENFTAYLHSQNWWVFAISTAAIGVFVVSTVYLIFRKINFDNRKICQCRMNPNNPISVLCCNLNHNKLR